MNRIAPALAAMILLAGCGIFGGGDKKPKTPVLGQRTPVLTSETGAEVDAGLADVAVEAPPAEVNTAWTQPGGNAAKSMGHPALGASISRAWTADVAGSDKRVRLAAAPIVADGRVYVIDTRATLRAFSTATGREEWTTRVGAEKDLKGGLSFLSDEYTGSSGSLFGGGVSFDNGRLYATNGLGDVAAIDATNGSTLWRVRPGGPLRGAPTVAGGQLYVVSQDNQIFALSAEDGKTIWNEAATIEVTGVFGVAAPAVAQGTVVAGFSSGELTAYRYENGRPVWQDALSRTSISTSVASLSDIDADPVIDQGRVYALGQGGRMVAMELVTGQRLWELNIAGISTPWVAGEWIYVVTDEAKLFCIARVNGRVRWMTQLKRWRDEKDKKGPVTWTGPILAGNRLILANTRGEMIEVALADGRVTGEREVGNAVNLPPVVADNTLYILDSKGKLTAWR